MKFLRSMIPFSFLLLAFIITGCISGKSGVPNYIYSSGNSNQSGDYSYIVLGAGLPESSKISSYLYNLLYDGQFVGLQGVKKENAVEFGSMNHHYTYLKSHGYLIWRVPVSPKNDNEALVYPAVIGDSANNYFYFDYWKDVSLMSQPMATGIYPFIGTITDEGRVYMNSYAAASEKPPISSFQGCFIKVKKQKIYYLGDTKIDAGIISKNKDTTTVINANATINSNKAGLKEALLKLNLPDYDIVDLSGDWKKLPIDTYNKQTRKHLK